VDYFGNILVNLRTIGRAEEPRVTTPALYKFSTQRTAQHVFTIRNYFPYFKNYLAYLNAGVELQILKS
jgi:hypothetical protein